MEFVSGDEVVDLLRRTDELVDQLTAGSVPDTVAASKLLVQRMVGLTFGVETRERGRLSVRASDGPLGPSLEFELSDGAERLASCSVQSPDDWKMEVQHLAHRYGELRLLANSTLRLGVDQSTKVGSMLEELAAQLDSAEDGWLRIGVSPVTENTHELSAFLGRRAVVGTTRLTLEVPATDGVADAAPRISMAIDPAQNLNTVITSARGVVRELTARWPTGRAGIARDAAEQLLRAAAARHDDPNALYEFEIVGRVQAGIASVEFAIRDPRTGRVTDRGDISIAARGQEWLYGPMGNADLWELVIEPDANRDRVVQEAFEQFRDVSWGLAWQPEQEDVAWLLAEMMVGNVVDRPGTSGVLVVKRLGVGPAEVVGIEVHVRGTQAPVLSLVEHAHHYGVEVHGPASSTAWMVLHNGTPESAELAAALADRGTDVSDQDVEVATDPLPPGLGEALRSATTEFADLLVRESRKRSGGDLALTAVEMELGQVRLEAVERFHTALPQDSAQDDIADRNELSPQAAAPQIQPLGGQDLPIDEPAAEVGNNLLTVAVDALFEDPRAYQLCFDELPETQRTAIELRLKNRPTAELVATLGQNHETIYHEAIHRFRGLLLGYAEARPEAAAELALIERSQPEILEVIVQKIEDPLHQKRIALRFLHGMPPADVAAETREDETSFRLREYRAIQLVAGLLRQHRAVESGNSTFVGTVHRTDPDHPQSYALRRLVYGWVGKTTGVPRIIVVEGLLREPGPTARAALSSQRGEMAFLGYIARKFGIEITSLEEDVREQARVLIAGSSPEAVFLYYVLRQIPQGIRAQNVSQADIDEHVRGAVEMYAWILPGIVDLYAKFQELMERYYSTQGFPRQFNKDDQLWLVAETVDMVEGGLTISEVQLVAAACHERREMIAAKKIQDLVDHDIAVLAAFGIVHFDLTRRQMPDFAGDNDYELESEVPRPAGKGGAPPSRAALGVDGGQALDLDLAVAPIPGGLQPWVFAGFGPGDAPHPEKLKQPKPAADPPRLNEPGSPTQQGGPADRTGNKSSSAPRPPGAVALDELRNRLKAAGWPGHTINPIALTFVEVWVHAAQRYPDAETVAAHLEVRITVTGAAGDSVLRVEVTDTQPFQPPLDNTGSLSTPERLGQTMGASHLSHAAGVVLLGDGGHTTWFEYRESQPLRTAPMGVLVPAIANPRAGDEPATAIAPPEVPGVLQADRYRFLDGTEGNPTEGKAMSGGEAVTLYNAARTHGDLVSGSEYDMYTLGDFVVLVPRSSPRVDYVLWNQLELLEAIASFVDAPRVLYKDKHNRFHIMRRIHGEPIDARDYPAVAAELDRLRAQYAQVPLERLPRLPRSYPKSGDVPGFLMMLAGYEDRVYQGLKQNPRYAAKFTALKIPASLLEGLAEVFAEAEPEQFALIHGDLIPSHILRGSDGVAVFNYRRARYGPPSFDAAVIEHRCRGNSLDLLWCFPRLLPYFVYLDIAQVLQDYVLLIDGLYYGTIDYDQAHKLALNVYMALFTADSAWGTCREDSLAYLQNMVEESFNRPRNTAAISEADTHAPGDLGADAPGQRRGDGATTIVGAHHPALNEPSTGESHGSSKPGAELESATQDDFSTVARLPEAEQGDQGLAVADSGDGKGETVVSADIDATRLSVPALIVPQFGGYDLLSGRKGQPMSRDKAWELREKAIASGQHRFGYSNDVYLYGQVAVRIPKVSADLLDKVIWPQHQFITAVAPYTARMPQLLYVELDSAGKVVFEVYRRVFGQPVDSLAAPPVAKTIEQFLEEIAQAPLSRFPPLPGYWPESGDAAGFVRMYAEDLQQRYQPYWTTEPYRSILIELKFGNSLIEGLESIIRKMRSEPFQPLHGDLTIQNILEQVKTGRHRFPASDIPHTHLVIDIDLATYGPLAFDLAIVFHRNPGIGMETLAPRSTLLPYIAYLDMARSFHDVVRLVDAARSGTMNRRDAESLARNLLVSLGRTYKIWGLSRTPLPTVSELLDRVSAPGSTDNVVPGFRRR
ncbi:phosphotransferase [Nocardia sp. NBC_00403]|uniref:phosphotransferase n=1 Tax=Nocardia sp. NBC_00403 TaxID=2975990 RepID=UPI002E1E1C6B